MAVMLAAVCVVQTFSAPGFEDYMRCESVLPNQKPAPIPPQRDKECEHLGHVLDVCDATYSKFTPNVAVASLKFALSGVEPAA